MGGRSRRKHGFSLIELSVVLVIIGLMVGGILAGRSLVRASQLNSIITDYQHYSTAIQAFHDKYMALPGDMKNATQYWGYTGTTVALSCANKSGTANTTPGTCDGDGSGTIDYGSSASDTGEAFQAWRQLALAGLLEGGFSGVAGPGSAGDYIPGINSPRSKITGATWMLTYMNNITGTNTWMFAYNYVNWMGVGGTVKPTDGTHDSTWADNAFLSNSEAWSIDTKLDDGMPATGSVHALAITPGGVGAACTNATSATNLTATYNLTSKVASACALLFKYQ